MWLYISVCGPCTWFLQYLLTMKKSLFLLLFCMNFSPCSSFVFDWRVLILISAILLPIIPHEQSCQGHIWSWFWPLKLMLTDKNPYLISLVDCFSSQTVREFLPHMLEQKKGHIVTIASMAGRAGAPLLTDYWWVEQWLICFPSFDLVCFLLGTRLQW